MSSLKVISWLIDLGSLVLAHFAVEPAAGVQAARLSGQRESPLAEMLAQEFFIERRQIADLADAPGLQILFGHLADAGDLADVERRQESRLLRPGSTHRMPFGLA